MLTPPYRTSASDAVGEGVPTVSRRRFALVRRGTEVIATVLKNGKADAAKAVQR